MSKQGKRSANGTMLELWRPPQEAGPPVGCLATTFTFDAGLFDEQCLARFLGIESEPDREDLAFLLERETKLGGVYAGVLVDHSQAGVEHSLRWDVLPVRIHGGCQHAKLSLLAWAERIRVVVASANLTEPGYRYNREVSIAIEASPRDAHRDHLNETCAFLRRLLGLVPGASPEEPAVRRAMTFLDQVERQVSTWKQRKSDRLVQQRLVFTLPAQPENPATGDERLPARSSLNEAVRGCRTAGGVPEEAWIASPFFDPGDGEDAATAAMCKAMPANRRHLAMCVPLIGDGSEAVPRLAAPASLLRTAEAAGAEVLFEILPEIEDKQVRAWHAKMLALRSGAYEALMVGSSNFTRAGLGIGPRRNAEANLLTIAERRRFAREPNELADIWPEMKAIHDPASAEWLGPQEDKETSADGKAPLPAGFLSAMYRAGDQRWLVLRFDATGLPATWAVSSAGREPIDLLDSDVWQSDGKPAEVIVIWTSPQPPEKLLVRWWTAAGDQGEGFWALNVEDARLLPPPADLEKMTADDMLAILGAADPSAAIRAYARQKQQRESWFDDEFDSALPADLDPLKRHDLHATFLHRIRRRARVLAAVRANLERPAWGEQALQWRLRGLIGIEPLARRLVQEVAEADGKVDEALLALADLLLVLREVDYKPSDGALPRDAFEAVYEPFLAELVSDLEQRVRTHRSRVGYDVRGFWDRVIKRCQG